MSVNLFEAQRSGKGYPAGALGFLSAARNCFIFVYKQLLDTEISVL